LNYVVQLRLQLTIVVCIVDVERQMNQIEIKWKLMRYKMFISQSLVAFPSLYMSAINYN